MDTVNRVAAFFVGGHIPYHTRIRVSRSIAISLTPCPLGGAVKRQCSRVRVLVPEPAPLFHDASLEDNVFALVHDDRGLLVFFGSERAIRDA